MTGYVYALTNPDYPGSFKIGMTVGSPEARARQLSAETGVRSPFEVFCANQTPFPKMHEQAAHEALAAYRDSPSKEFFTAPADVVIGLFDEMSEAIRLRRWWMPLHMKPASALAAMIPPIGSGSLQSYEARKMYQAAEELELNDDGTCPHTAEKGKQHILYSTVRLPAEINTLDRQALCPRSLRTSDPEVALEKIRILLMCIAQELDNHIMTKEFKHE